MNVEELVFALSKMPPNALVSFLCPDGYEDWVECVELEGGRACMSGYSHQQRVEREMLELARRAVVANEARGAVTQELLGK